MPNVAWASGSVKAVGYDSPADVAAACRHFVAQRFRMLKLHQIDIASVRAAREAVGPDVELMLDTNCHWTTLDDARDAEIVGGIV